MSTTTKKKELKDSAATAALKVTGASSKSKYPLDADNKLSSASAAQSLKRAQPRDLPSFPSTGIANKEASAGAAASLAFAGHKSFEHWKPEHSQPAGKAALLAHDSKPPEFWQPEASVAGSKAALLAHKHTASVEIWQPDPTSEGNSAAGIAMRGEGKDEASKPKPSTPALGDTRRRRADSIPVSYAYPDSTNSASNALKAATKAAHGPRPETPVYNDLPGFSPEEAARIHKAATTNMDRSMYTSSPPVAPEVEEKNRQAVLRAAAISMAKNMMAAQERAAEMHRNDGSETAARASHGNKPSVEADRREAALQYLNLHDAATKLAAERLAKINDENEEYRQYYGAFSPNKSRLSLRARRRSSSDGQLDVTDRARSEKIRSEMSLFSSKLAEVDSKKRQSDRDALLLAAQNNVRNSMKGLDEKVFQETGKVSPAMKAQWEASARERAEKDSKVRMENYGKVHIGGGQYMDQSAINAIAAARVQPTLDEVTRKAEAQRAFDEQRRQEAEEMRRVTEAKAAEERERKRDTKQVWQKFKSEEKERKKAEKEQQQVKQIYQATADEQDRKARAAEQERDRKARIAEEEAKKAVADKEERERAAKTDAQWKQLKEAEKKETEEDKARKNQERRKSRIGGMFASIGFGDREKKDEFKEPKGKSPEVAMSKSAETAVSKAEMTEKDEQNEANQKVEFTAIKVESVGKSVLPGAGEDPSVGTEASSVPTDLKGKKPETGESAVVPTVAPPAAAGATTTTLPTAPVTPKAMAEREEVIQSWFKRKFSRGSKEDRPQPGTLSKQRKPGDETSKDLDSKSKALKISAPIPIGSSAIATTSQVPESIPSTAGTESIEHAASKDETASTDADGILAIAAATALPSHLSTVHRSDTDTNLSERDVALAGKEEPQSATSNTAAGQGLILSSIPEPPKSKDVTRSRSTSISSLSSHASGTPSNSMRGAASAALAAGQRLDAEEALRQTEESQSLKKVDTTRTSESQDMFEEARDGLDDLNPSSAAAKTDVRSPSSNSTPGHRETKFHEDL